MVKSLAPFDEPQNSWDLWMFIPLELIMIGFDPPPFWLSETQLTQLHLSSSCPACLVQLLENLRGPMSGQWSDKPNGSGYEPVKKKQNQRKWWINRMDLANHGENWLAIVVMQPINWMLSNANSAAMEDGWFRESDGSLGPPVRALLVFIRVPPAEQPGTPGRVRRPCAQDERRSFNAASLACSNAISNSPSCVICFPCMGKKTLKC